MPHDLKIRFEKKKRSRHMAESKNATQNVYHLHLVKINCVQ